MPLTLAEARDEMLGLVRDAAAGLDVYVVWENTAFERPEDDPVTPWIRAGVQHATRQQSSLAGSTGVRIYTSTGILTVEVNTPPNDGYELADELAETFRNAFEGVSTSNGVWFRNVRTSEVGLVGGWWRTDVLADFTYDEVR